MRFLDENDIEIIKPDLTVGYLLPDTHFVSHHDAVQAVAEQGHYETVAEYESGGQDVAWVVDVPGVQAADAWDEYEDIMRYKLYTPDELAAKSVPTEVDRLEAAEAAIAELAAMLGGGGVG